MSMAKQQRQQQQRHTGDSQEAPKQLHKVNRRRDLKKTPGDLRKQIRSVERLLKSKGDTLNAQAKNDQERKLQGLKYQLDTLVNARQNKTKSSKLEGMYKGVRFIETIKAVRRVRKAQHALEAVTDKDDQKKLQARLKEAEVDLCYAVHFPPGVKYIGLFPENQTSDGTSIARRQQIRRSIQEQIDAGLVTPQKALDAYSRHGERKRTKRKGLSKEQKEREHIGKLLRGSATTADQAPDQDNDMDVDSESDDDSSADEQVLLPVFRKPAPTDMPSSDPGSSSDSDNSSSSASSQSGGSSDSNESDSEHVEAPVTVSKQPLASSSRKTKELVNIATTSQARSHTESEPLPLNDPFFIVDGVVPDVNGDDDADNNNEGDDGVQVEEQVHQKPRTIERRTQPRKQAKAAAPPSFKDRKTGAIQSSIGQAKTMHQRFDEDE
ncbi:18S rRNA maturation protein [Sorochytrium milnesiophthora]